MKRTIRLLALTAPMWSGAGLESAAMADDFDIDPATAATDPSAKSTAERVSSVKVNEITFGVGSISGATAMSGRYDGLKSSGIYTVGSFHLLHRVTEDDHDTTYAEFEGDGLNITGHTLLPSASMSLKVGQQGLWGMSLAYDGTPYIQSTNYKSLFDSNGNLSAGLKAKSISTTATTGAATVNKYLNTQTVGTRRDKMDAKATYAGLEDWVFSADVQHEHKLGTKINSMMFLSNANFATFAEPVDYDTDTVTVTSGYTGEKLQTQFSYVFSSFRDNQDQYSVLSPFSGTVRSGYTTSQYSLPPDNMEHQLKGSLGYSLTPDTHVAMNARYGLQLQNDDYAARYYEYRTVAAPGVSGNGYSGLIQNIYANTVLTTRPSKDSTLKLGYSIDDRDNMGQIYKLAAYRADGSAAFNGGGAYSTNAPYSFLFQKANVEAGYKLAKSTKLTLDYLFDDRFRTYSVTNHNRENTVGGQIRTSLTPTLSNSIAYHRGIRMATNYSGNAGWQYMSRSITGETNLAQYNYAARVRDEVKDNLIWGRGEDWSMGGTVRYVMDSYPSTYFGVTSSRAVSAGPDVNFTVVPGLTAHLFYTYELNSIANDTSYTTSGTNSTIWHLQNRDSVQTIGGGTQWKPTDRLTFSVEDTLSAGNTAFDEATWVYTASTASTSTAVSLPTARSVTNLLKLSGEYELEDGVYFGVTGLWQRYMNQDYLLTEAVSSSANQASTAVVSNDGNSSYSVKAIVATMRMAW